MKSVFQTIEQNKMIETGNKIGIAVSGGLDSMCLLHFLFTQKDTLGISVVAINVDHNIRKNSAEDSKFVEEFCKENKIPLKKIKVQALKTAEENKIGVEEAARLARYAQFDKLLKEKVVDKIALGHHMQDQVETILLNLFRGSGLSGASGMDAVNGQYIRPFLNTSRLELMNYAKLNHLEHVEDETNADTAYARNFLRHEIIPALKKHWENVENNLINFARICKEDDAYIASQVSFQNILVSEGEVKIPLSYFSLPQPIVNRALKYALEAKHIQKDMEKKHLELIKHLALKGQNGDKINLPNSICAVKEYLFLTLTEQKSEKTAEPVPFCMGKLNINDYDIEVKKVKTAILGQSNCHVVDLDNIPSNCVWRTRKDGDTFTKFGGGTKKLNDYMIDKKIPSRQRSRIPLLTNGSKVLLILGVELADEIKVTKATKNIGEIKYQKK